MALIVRSWIGSRAWFCFLGWVFVMGLEASSPRGSWEEGGETKAGKVGAAGAGGRKTLNAIGGY